MPLSRNAFKTLLLAAGFALVSHPAAQGQDTPLPRKPNTSLLNTLRTERPRGGISAEELPEARKAFEAYAKYFADVVAHPLVWKASQEIKADPFSRIPVLDGPNGIMHDIDRYLLEPVPGGPKSGNLEPASYIREMGAAFDAAFKKLIETSPEKIVRINAARVLAHVARTGAPAHFPTVTAMLADPKTPTAIKYYLFRAAAGMLNASDPIDTSVRKHAVDPQVVGALVKVLEECITNPAMLVPGYKPETATPEQLQVIGMVRRQAVRALAQVKFVTVPGPDGKTPLYPSYTLVRIAMSDPRLVPAPGPAECAEAVIGLCNMAPAQWQGSRLVAVKSYNADVAVEAMTQGLITFAEPRAGNRSDRTLPWRTYALRIAEAMMKAKPLFDIDATPAYLPTKFEARFVPQSFDQLYRFTLPNVLAPMDKVDNKDNPVGDPNVPGLRDLLNRMKTNPKRKTVLFDGLPQTTIEFPRPKQ